MRHPQEVVTKRNLLEDVWGHESDADPNVVEVYVGYLRQEGRRALRPPLDRDGARRRLPGGRTMA